jgi:hypothetical protein
MLQSWIGYAGAESFGERPPPGRRFELRHLPQLVESLLSKASPFSLGTRL